MVVISPNGSNATVILDGSSSSDPENDPLQYFWHEAGETNIFAIGAVSTNTLPVGSYEILLLVSDGAAVGSDKLDFEIITAAEAASDLISQIEVSAVPRRTKRALIASL